MVIMSASAVSTCATVRPAAPRTRNARPTSTGNAEICPSPGPVVPPSDFSASIEASRRLCPMNFGRMFTHTMIAPSEPNT